KNSRQHQAAPGGAGLPAAREGESAHGGHTLALARARRFVKEPPEETSCEVPTSDSKLDVRARGRIHAPATFPGGRARSDGAIVTGKDRRAGKKRHAGGVKTPTPPGGRPGGVEMSRR